MMKFIGLNKSTSLAAGAAASLMLSNTALAHGGHGELFHDAHHVLWTLAAASVVMFAVRSIGKYLKK